MIHKIKDWLEGQGFSLEMQAASAFRAAGFEVRQSSYYSDSETGKGREIDVVARDPDTLGVVDITFIVECKSTKKPWVILCSPDVLAGYNRLFAFGVLSEKAIRFMAENMTNLVTRIDWLQKDGLVGYSARQRSPIRTRRTQQQSLLPKRAIFGFTHQRVTTASLQRCLSGHSG